VGWRLHLARDAYVCEPAGWCAGLNIRIWPPQFRLHQRVGDQPGPPRGCKVPRMQVSHPAPQTHQLAAATTAHAEADAISPTAGNRSGSYSRTARTGGRPRRSNCRPQSQAMGIQTARHEVSLSPILRAVEYKHAFPPPSTPMGTRLPDRTQVWCFAPLFNRRRQLTATHACTQDDSSSYDSDSQEEDMDSNSDLLDSDGDSLDSDVGPSTLKPKPPTLGCGTASNRTWPSARNT
jgi:hypothetical protein